MLIDPSVQGETSSPHVLGRLARLEKRAQVSLSAAELAVDESPVSCIMTREVQSFSAATTLEEATRIMLERGISGAPVIDDAGRPVGIVSKTDLLEAWQQHTQSAQDEALRSHPSRRAVDLADAGPDDENQGSYATGVAVGDIMVPYLLAVSHQAPIALAAALMAYEGVHRLLVLDEGNRMVGIVSALDVLRWLAQLTGFCLPRYTQRQRG